MGFCIFPPQLSGVGEEGASCSGGHFTQACPRALQCMLIISVKNTSPEGLVCGGMVICFVFFFSVNKSCI